MGKLIKKEYLKTPEKNQVCSNNLLFENGIRPDCKWYDFGRTAPSAYGAFCEKTRDSLYKKNCIECKDFEKITE